MALDEKPIDDLELERGLTPEPEQQETTEEKIKEGQRSGAGPGSLFGILALTPLGIYSYLNSPDQYSARKLEKEAQKYARNKVKEIVKSAQKTKTYTAEEKNTFHQMSLDGYYDGYVQDHQKRAGLLAKKSTNQQLLNAIERRNKENETNDKEITDKQETESQSKQPAAVSTTAPTSAPILIAPIAENFRNLSTTNLASPMEMPNNKPSTQSSGVSMPSAPSLPGSNTPGGVKPSVPSAPDKMPSIPGKRRGLPHLPKPGLPGLPNPIQNIRSLAFLLNPTNIIIFFIFGIILSTFLIVLMLGGPGVGLAGEPTQPPVCTGGKVQPMPISEVAKYFIFNENITSAGYKADMLSSKQQDYVLERLSRAMGSKGYFKLLTNDGKRKIHLVFHHDGGYLSGGALYNTSIPQIDGWNFFGSQSDTVKEHWIVHETGHLIDRYNNRISQGGTSYGGEKYSRTTLAKDDPTCYNNYCKLVARGGRVLCERSGGDYYIKSYAFRDVCKVDGGGADSETFAESLADYITCKPGENCDYNGVYCSMYIKFNTGGKGGGCDSTYNWFQKNIFGGDDFFATGTQVCTPPGGGESTTDMCGGFYAGPASVKYTDAYNSTVINTRAGRNIYMQRGVNFGDPQCDLVNARSDPKIREKEYLYLQQIDPKNAKYWWDVIIPCESAHSYSPFAYNPNSYSKLGAYGLLQMNPSINPYTGKSRGTTTDIGDVVWRQQLQNGVNRSKNMTYFRQYWECASNGVKVIK